MKILFLSNGNLPDYQNDSVLLGLKQLCGDDVVDYRRAWYLYKDSFGPGKANLAECYGRGFTLYSMLDSDAGCDRTDIVEKLKKKYFDIVIWGQIQRNQAYLGGVLSVYPKNKLVMIDGEDYPTTLPLFDKAIFMKRELGDGGIEGILPIHFGVPSCKILKGRPEKTKFIADYDPLINKQYTFETEQDYYDDYKRSYFGVTMKKAGWECLRHAEICSQYCLPYFRVLDGAPALTMHRLPRKELLMVMRLIEYGKAGMDTAIDFYDRIIDPFMEHVRANLTTESVAKYVLDTVAAANK
jgi:hypothetical protein